ncbi:head-tail connector protein [Sphingomonas sp. Leaf208]|uniref:head-tail connector protein n=1 Tax=Sphingomonas sp. Leaf208 TaxID=1735679 RepID=UPI000AB60C8F|nr:head-tail connector protein [Sphingomonas sp. Leaf208]
MITIIEPPKPVVTWEDMAPQLALEADDIRKPLVEAYVAAATSHIDGPTGWLQRCIGVQTLEIRFEAARSRCVALPCPPVIDIVSLSYLDLDGVLQEASVDGVELVDGTLHPITGAWSWETASARRDAVRVRYRAGYETVPPSIKVAIMMMATDLFRNRGTVAVGLSATSVPMSTTVEALLGPFQVFR